jgi:hypothetical protein
LTANSSFQPAPWTIAPEAGRDFGKRLGLDPTRAYGDWREMLDGEKNRDDRIDLVTVATPNATHYEITKAYLEAGFHVLCEKPMTMTVEPKARTSCAPHAPRERSAPSITATPATRWSAT